MHITPIKMRYNNKGIAENEISPFNYKRDWLPDPRGRCAVHLWLFCGYTQRKAYEIAFNWKGSQSSLPVASTLFFRSNETEEYILELRYYFIQHEYLNVKSLKL